MIYNLIINYIINLACFIGFMVEIYLLQCKLYENYARLQRAEVLFFFLSLSIRRFK